MSRKNNVCRNFLLLFIILNCFLVCCGGDEEEEDCPLEWVDPNNPIVASKKTVKPDGKDSATLTPMVKKCPNPNINYLWDVTERDKTTGKPLRPVTSWLHPQPPANLGSPKTFKPQEDGIFFVIVLASDAKSTISSASAKPTKIETPNAAPTISNQESNDVEALRLKVISASRITSPQNDDEVDSIVKVKGEDRAISFDGINGVDGDEDNLINQAPQYSTKLALDPLKEGYMLNILVIDSEEDYGVLHKPIDIGPNGTWEQEITIGRPEDRGKNKSFELKLILIDRQRLGELEDFENFKTEEVEENLPLTIPSISEMLKRLKESVKAQNIFDDTFHQIKVRRK